MPPTNASVYEISVLWRMLSTELQERPSFKPFQNLEVDNRSPSPPLSGSASRVRRSALASVVSFLSSKRRRPDEMDVDKLTQGDKVAGGYADLSKITDSRASTLARFLARIFFLFGAPGDPLPPGAPVDEGRSARYKLTTYIALYVSIMAFGPWPPPTSTDSTTARSLRTLIIETVEASLHVMPADPKKLSFNTILTLLFLCELALFRFRASCLHTTYTQLIKVGLMTSSGLLTYDALDTLSETNIATIHEMIRKPDVLYTVLETTPLGNQIKDIYCEIYIRSPKSAMNRMEELYHYWPDVFSLKMFSQFIPATRDGEPVSIPFLTGVPQPVAHLAFVIILILCASKGIATYAKKQKNNSGISQVFKNSTFKPEDRLTEDLQTYHNWFEMLIETFGRHEGAITVAKTLAMDSLPEELPEQLELRQDLFRPQTPTSSTI